MHTVIAVALVLMLMLMLMLMILVMLMLMIMLMIMIMIMPMLSPTRHTHTHTHPIILRSALLLHLATCHYTPSFAPEAVLIGSNTANAVVPCDAVSCY